MKNLTIVIVLVAFVTGSFSTAATCLILRHMARTAKVASSTCIDSMEILTTGSTECSFSEQRIEVWPMTKERNLIKCLCPHQGVK
jgi:hypothetical protein